MKEYFLQETEDMKNIPERKNEGKPHPSPEELLIREATKFLTVKQKAVWAYYNYDRLTQDEIATKLHITQQAVQAHINRIEKRIAKWVKSNLGAYNLLKTEFGPREDILDLTKIDYKENP